ncbi:MAG: TonB family protein [Lyngbya sp. HA4199-MV5]|nr:TonB family protein [Lyngbya sp. HA4199-MV5]
MLASDLTTAQRIKEGKAITRFLLWSFLGSAAFHTIAMASTPTAFWNSLPEAEEDTIEVVAEPETPVEPEKPVEQKVETPPPEAAPEVAFAPPPPLAPANQAPQTPGEDAPTNKPSVPSPTAANSLTSKTGEDSGLRIGGGPIFSPFGKGFGFGDASRPTGFNPLGQPNGDPKSAPNGNPGGTPGSTATRTTAPPVPAPNQMTCLSCPKPSYRGTEGSPRVDMTVRPDGSVEVRLRKSSGNPETDRETLETMSKWRFDPKTVPEGGIKKRVRVEYEEEGSNTQRRNEERRRQEAEQRQAVEQERQRREAQERQRQQPTTAVETPERTAPASPTPAPTTEKPVAPSAAPAPAPSMEAPPAPVEAAPPASPAPAPAPAPAETVPPTSGQ